MAFREKISLIIDVTTTTASSSLGRLRTDLKNTEGGFNKMRTASAGAFDFMKQNAAQFAALAGTALAGFATKAVSDFQDVALGAGELRDSLGVTAEEASKLQEVAGDLGISVESLESGIGRMNRAVATTPDAFDDIGAAIARNTDGTVNVTETFLNVSTALARIPDATDRAAAAQKIFGRGWQNMSELVVKGGENIREAMDEVEAGKIVGDEQITDARRFRDALDDLKGNVEELSTAVGGYLVPKLADAAEHIQAIIELARDLELPEIVGWAEDVKNAWPDSLPPILPTDQIPWIAGKLGDFRDQVVDLGGDWTRTAHLTLDAARIQAEMNTVTDAATRSYIAQGEALENMEPPASAATSALGSLSDAMFGADGATEAIVDGMDSLGDAMFGAEDPIDAAAEALAQAAENTGILEQAAYELDQQWLEMLGELDDRDALRNLERAFDEVHEKAVEAFEANTTGAENAEQATRDHEQSVDDLKREIIDYAREVAGISPRQVTEIEALIDQGKLNEAEALLANLARERRVAMRIVATGDVGVFRSAANGSSKVALRMEAAGGYSPPGYTNIAGEAGMEFAGRGVAIGAQVVRPGTAVTSTRRSADIASQLVAELQSARSGSSASYSITVNAPTGRGADIVEVLRREMWRRGAVPRAS